MGQFTLSKLLLALAAVMMGVALIMTVLSRAYGEAREAAAERLMDNLSQGITTYYNDYNVYPPGRGTGSRDLAATREVNGRYYFQFMPDQLLPGTGDIVNPVFPGEGPPGGIIYYRNNQASGGVTVPTPRHSRSFDLWCHGLGGRILDSAGETWDARWE